MGRNTYPLLVGALSSILENWVLLSYTVQKVQKVLILCTGIFYS